MTSPVVATISEARAMELAKKHQLKIEKVRENRRKYRAKHGEKINELRRQRYRSDPAYREKIKRGGLKWYYGSHDEVCEHRRKRRREHPELFAAYAKKQKEKYHKQKEAETRLPLLLARIDELEKRVTQLLEERELWNKKT